MFAVGHGCEITWYNLSVCSVRMNASPISSNGGVYILRIVNLALYADFKIPEEGVPRQSLCVGYVNITQHFHAYV